MATLLLPPWFLVSNGCHCSLPTAATTATTAHAPFQQPPSASAGVFAVVGVSVASSRAPRPPPFDLGGPATTQTWQARARLPIATWPRTSMRRRWAAVLAPGWQARFWRRCCVGERLVVSGALNVTASPRSGELEWLERMGSKSVGGGVVASVVQNKKKAGDVHMSESRQKECRCANPIWGREGI